MLRNLIHKLVTESTLWLQRTGEVARFDGIILSDIKTDKKQPQHFREILLAALSLLKDTDPRRFARVQKRLAYIVNTTCALRGVTQYNHATKTCRIDFLPPSSAYDSGFLVGWYAGTLVHEATHGMIRARGVFYTEKLRRRIERLCVREEQRFVTQLRHARPELAARLYREFDASLWNEAWTMSAKEQSLRAFRRVFFQE